MTEITPRQLWITVDTSCGITFIPWDDAPDEAQTFILACRDIRWDWDEIPDQVADSLLPFLPIKDRQRILKIRYQFGHGARVDNQSWTLHETEQEAKDWLVP